MSILIDQNPVYTNSMSDIIVGQKSFQELKADKNQNTH
jgi:hypothetical protein